MKEEQPKRIKITEIPTFIQKIVDVVGYELDAFLAFLCNSFSLGKPVNPINRIPQRLLSTA